LAVSGADKPISDDSNSDLQQAVDAWTNLSETVKAGIVAHTLV